MPNKALIHPKNVPGPYYCTDTQDLDQGCVACNICFTDGGDFFTDDENGNAYVKKQPTNPEEVAVCEEMREFCPIQAIGNNGNA